MMSPTSARIKIKEVVNGNNTINLPGLYENKGYLLGTRIRVFLAHFKGKVQNAGIIGANYN